MVVSLTVAAIETKRATLAPIVTTLHLRHPLAAALAISSLHDLTGGRAVFTIASGDRRASRRQRAADGSCGADRSSDAPGAHDADRFDSGERRRPGVSSGGRLGLISEWRAPRVILVRISHLVRPSVP
jgi:hypothetical protein